MTVNDRLALFSARRRQQYRYVRLHRVYHDRARGTVEIVPAEGRALPPIPAGARIKVAPRRRSR